jgi:glycerol-3-phosphate dehydrogenase (NAD(P)+)
MKKVGMLGEGAWGTAVSTLLAHNDFHVKLWCYDKAVAVDIQKTRYNDRYLPNIFLNERIEPIIAIEEVVRDVDIIFEAIPVQFLRETIERCKPYITRHQQWIILSKGMERDTLFLPTEIVDDVLRFSPHKVVLLGPSYAKDLAQKQITAVTLAATHCSFGLQLQKMLANGYFRPYISLDLIGPQVGGALKNVIALAIGMLDGADFKDNVKAYVLTRGLHEMQIVTKLLGGKPETIYGLAGVGDLVLTAMGMHSKNQEVGRRLAQGQTLDSILQETGFIPEGINTAYAMQQLIEKEKLDLPVCGGVYAVIKGKKTIHDVLHDLMNRPLEQECIPK